MTAVAGVSLGGALWGLTVDRDGAQTIAYVLSMRDFLGTQDAPVLWLFVAFFAAVALLFRYARATSVGGAIARREAFGLALLTLVVACGIIWAGSALVYRHYALSLDEFWADFDARVFASGRLLASVAPEWRAYVPALQPTFRLELPGNGYWISSYLPMNAALRAPFVLIGDPALEGVALAGVAILALFGVARRLWPDRPDAALVGVVLLACSSQFLITAMTPYAMTAHLALNMVWLWLFLRDTRTSHALAAGVAFVASGLHQVIFHPLFAAPFVASLVFARRWKLAAYYGAVYALVGLFWILYWSLLVRAVDTPATQAADVGMLNFIHRIAVMLAFDLEKFLLMAPNLLRLLAWQSPIVFPLAIVGLSARGERRGILLCLAAGMVLTVGAAIVLAAYQGHGWGYRYLHGFLGGLSLMAAQGWICITDRDSRPSRAPALALALSVVVSLVVVLPWYAHQVSAFIKPSETAVAAIQRSDADVVIVDGTDIWYGQDLVRNDPFLRTLPKTLLLSKLDATRLTELCRRYDVALFDRTDAERIGMAIVPRPLRLTQRARELRPVMQSLGCGHPILAGR
ncbi:MAG TPA: hypothetical protein VLX44_12785 [Xanthobacteraceae bacterium]|nr:hypothetical protein [Xanthobacteraceae bacterium]